MTEVNFWAIVVATIVAFITSAVYYMVTGNAMAKLQAVKSNTKTDDSMPPWKVLIELARSLTVVLVVTCLFSMTGSTGIMAAIGLGVLLWVGFPVVLFAGSIIHENFPWKLAAIHLGDWLVKLLIITAIIGVWQ